MFGAQPQGGGARRIGGGPAAIHCCTPTASSGTAAPAIPFAAFPLGVTAGGYYALGDSLHRNPFSSNAPPQYPELTFDKNQGSICVTGDCSSGPSFQGPKAFGSCICF